MKLQNTYRHSMSLSEHIKGSAVHMMSPLNLKPSSRRIFARAKYLETALGE
jgi:hypothetical protein